MDPRRDRRRARTQGRRRSPPGAAVPDLRLGRRRQVDPDRPAALRAEPRSSTIISPRSTATSKNMARTGAEIDFALLLDGLEAEREQGITIDVAYRYFATPRRAFIVADTPGHEQYTRNMATGASNAELAVLLVDARKGFLSQTRRHAIIASLLGIRHVVLAVNKIDLVDFRSRRLRHHRRRASPALPARSASADRGDPDFGALRRQRLARAASARRGLTGRTCSTISRPSMSRTTARQAVPPAGAMGQPAEPRFPRLCRDDRQRHRRPATNSPCCRPARSREIKPDCRGRRRSRSSAGAGDAVTVTLADEIDVARGDMLAAPRDRPQVADQFAAHLVWMSGEQLLPGPLLSDEDQPRHAGGNGDRASSTVSTSTRWPSLRPRRWR